MLDERKPYCMSKKYDCSDCDFNKYHKEMNCDTLFLVYEKGKKVARLEVIKKLEELKDPRNKYTEHRRWNAALCKAIEVISNINTFDNDFRL